MTLLVGPPLTTAGVRVIELNDGTRPIRSIATAVIGLVRTAVADIGNNVS